MQYVRIFHHSSSSSSDPSPSPSPSPPASYRVSPPGSFTPRQRAFLDAMLRVDHAGETGAVRIYEGQLAVLGRGPERATLEHMAAGERVHLAAFERIVPEFRVRPSALLPLWGAAGYALGAGSALLGAAAAGGLDPDARARVARLAGQALTSPPSLAAAQARRSPTP